MATSINSICVVGNLTKDAEVKAIGETFLLSFSVACNETRKTNGKYEDYANFFDVTYFTKGGQKLSAYLKKGKTVAINGSLHQDRWEKDGQKRSAIKISAKEIQLVGGGNSASQSENNSSFPEDIPFGDY